MISSVRLSLLVVSVAALIGLASIVSHKPKTNATIIGILQFASHPSLDEATEHFKQAVKKNLGKDVSFIERNAQGSVSQAQLIAEQFHHDESLSAILAVATPAAQACAFIEKKRPILITAVTDPIAAGLDKSNNNVCGTTDGIDTKKMVALTKQLVPQAKTIGILFNQSEVNAVITSKQLTKELERQGITVIQQAFAQESDLPLVADRLLQRTDALVTPIDNTIAASMSMLAQKAIALKKAIIVPVNAFVAQGALAGAGIEYTVAGRKTGEFVCDILNGKKTTQEVGFVQTPVEAFCINKDTAAKIGLTIDPALASTSRIIGLPQGRRL